MREQDQQRPHLSRAQQNGGTRLTPFRLDSASPSPDAYGDSINGLNDMWTMYI